MKKKLSKSKNSLNFLSTSKRLPKKTKEELDIAYKKANDKIKRNNTVYTQSNSHANMHPTD